MIYNRGYYFTSLCIMKTISGLIGLVVYLSVPDLFSDTPP